MEDKLLNFVYDLTAFIWAISEEEDDSINFLQDNNISFCTNSYSSFIKFNHDWIFGEHRTDYEDLVEYVQEKIIAWKKLEIYLFRFFGTMTKEEIEEKYDIEFREK